MAQVFESFGYVILQNFLVSLAIPVLVVTYCKRRALAAQVLIMALTYLILGVLWLAFINSPVSPQWALAMACLGAWVFIRALARLA